MVEILTSKVKFYIVPVYINPSRWQVDMIKSVLMEVIKEEICILLEVMNARIVDKSFPYCCTKSIVLMKWFNYPQIEYLIKKGS